MSEAKNKQILQAAFAALASGDPLPYRDMLSDKVTWTVMGSTPWSRTWVGKPAVLNDLFGGLRSQYVESAITSTATAFHADGDFVAVEGKGGNRTKAGADYTNEYCWIFQMADGKVVDVTEYCDTQLVARVLEPPKR